MKKPSFLFLLPLLLITGAVCADEHGAALSHDPRIDARQQQQQKRVKQGIRSGVLTLREVRELRDESRDIRRKERSYRADGVLSRAERRELHRDLTRHAVHIYLRKHDDDRQAAIL